MKYDLTQLASKKVNSIEVDYEYDIISNDELLDYDNFKVTPIKVTGTIKSHGKGFFVDIEYNSTWVFLCGRCLDETDYVINGRIEKSVMRDRNDEDEDIIVVESSVIDLYDLIYNDIVLNIPTQVMCDEECKGLCHDCGVNLNHKACKCVQEAIDPRFEKLKSFFTQN